MDIISLLPDSVANQIAAGEVIQRPASVIKELVENAVDAGATVVNVLVVDAGRTSIQVIDNGQGMSETDARLAFERHATSKIRKADDLFDLHTMGFRGEALPSVAAVAQVQLLTRTAADQVGTRLTIAASKVQSQEPAACPVGANFLVENLFYNVPARRKFLKTNATELSNIMTAFERIVLVYPQVAFTLHSNGTEVLNLHAASQRQRIVDVFGKRINQDLLPVSVETSLCNITGFVGKPESAKRKESHNYFFVNGRYMKHAYFHKAVLSAYDRLIPEGTQVPYFIYFDVNPADIDVNIHPTKTEIKFENEQSIWQILSAAVKEAIGKFCEIPSIEFDTEGRPDIPVFDPLRDAVTSPRVTYNQNYSPFTSHPSPPTGGTSPFTSHAAPSTESPSLFTESTPPFTDSVPSSAIPTNITEDRSPVHYQYKGRYIMTAVKSGLMIIDQHRADVRVLFDRYMEQFQSRMINTQRVLFPEVLTFSPSEAVVLGQILPDLTKMGFEISDIGGGSFVVNGIPAGLEATDPQALVRSIVADAQAATGHLAEDLKASLALSLARSAAIVYGQVLSNQEMENMVNQLFSSSNVNYTPDGKAILCILPQHDIEQLLG